MVVLVVLVYLAVAASSVALLLRSSGRSAHAGPVQHFYEAAFLSGGPARVVDSALAELHADGRIVIGGPGIVSVRHPLAHDPVDRAVFDQLAAAPTGALHTLRREVMRHPAVQEIGDDLAARGLMTPPGENRGPRRWGCALALVCVLALPATFIVAIATLVETEGDSSSLQFLGMIFPALVAGVVIGLVVSARARRRITTAGRDALRVYRTQYATLCSAGHLVALNGLRAVPDPALQAQLTAAARTPGTSSHSSSGLSDYVALWCAGASPGSGCGGSSCGSSTGSGCASSGGSSCGSSSGSSCGGSSGGSSCGSSSGSSCGGGGGCGSSS